MKVVALLCWYDEPASWLAETVASTAKLCDHIVAVDGAYALWPDATRKPVSPPTQAETIVHAAAGAGIGATVHTPSGVWWGGQVEKRDFMFRVGETVAEAGDWFLIVDADEVLVQAPADTRATLDGCDYDAAELMIWERSVDHDDSRSMLRRLFRAQPDLRVRDAHHVVVAAGRVLAGDPHVHRVEPAASLPDVVLEHRPGLRPAHRRRLKDRYYRARDMSGVERLEAVGAGG